ncbi:hypothetical protein F0U44_19640 [Nocardioides humilatus]|uniref:Uncharacterized protein n=1 Tax=Nocardioides humilatus TaxID=2607660 RepID=A0A5B1L5Q7_9ACTN|nr:DUF5994 family protein [Nocardioides humilatus]KAA1415854.1 hypothetical protein F0U44_19640 [Nocardioides humilatus]
MNALRLRLGENQGQDRLDGGWWPHSRSLDTELGQLIDNFPNGRVIRALYSPPDWDDTPRRVAARGRYVKTGNFPRDDTHLMYLTTSDRVVYCLLVVPPSFNASQGEEALTAASTRGNTHSAGDLLDTVTNELAVDQAALWTDAANK